jgi:gliding motility-associated-like protein/uncharacterized repeat protein (TIGR01451 family)
MLKVLRRILLSIPKKLHFLFIFCLLVNFSAVYAEGSKDLYPAGVKGNRAFLYSNISINPAPTSIAFPFRTLGTHYVYAKRGEYIAVASSAQGIGNGQIRAISPSGVELPLISDGSISNRTREVGGPALKGQSLGTTRYLPHYIDVNEDGIWRIEFNPTGNKTDASIASPDDVYADGNWSQRNNSQLIAAWDISVKSPDNTAWLKGRVYANVLNLFVFSNLSTDAKAYYGTNYVLTKDGRAYRVKNNGSNGIGFTFFSNNKGFIDENGKPTYKSRDVITQSVIRDFVHDPRGADDNVKNLITHKLFYGPPAEDLPLAASVSLDGTAVESTWLKQAAIVPVVTDVRFFGSENLTPNQASQKGGYIFFNTNVPGTYRITIPVSGVGKDKVITGPAVQGENRIKWDGRDGNNDVLPSGQRISEIKVRLSSAEVHFPFFDMEINPGGIIIELAENTTKYLINPFPGVIDESVYSDRVYWDDSDISGGLSTEQSNPSVNTENGISSNANGHKWGTYSSSNGSGNSGTGTNSYGNEKGMDTYAYILSNERIEPLNIEIKVADLKVVSITPVGTHLTAGKQLSYVVKVKNDGQSDIVGANFQFLAPTGFQITGAILSPSACATESNQTISGSNYASSLSLKNGCEISYTVTGTIGSGMAAPPFRVEANIMRPADVTDPDATNTEFTQKPVTAATECAAVTSVNGCNNIKQSNVDVQEICVNTDITAIVYNGVAGGQVSLNGNVAGLNFVFTSGNTVLTVNGRPTASGSFTVGTVGNETETTTYIINVNQPPVLQPLSNVSVCEDKNAVFTVTSAEAGITYKWQFNDGKGGGWEDFAAGATGVSGVNTASVTLSNVPLASSGKQLRVIVTSALGCSSVSSVATLTVNKLPESAVVLPWDAQFCVGGTVTLTANGDATSFQWFKNGVAIAGEINQTYTASAEGDYHVVLKNDKGCESSASNIVAVNVYPDQPKPVISSEGNLTFCSGGVVKLKSSSATGNQWIKNNRPIVGENKPELTVSTPGTYRLVVTNPCSKLSDEIIITVNPIPELPTVSLSGGTTFCAGGSVKLTSSAPSGNQWYRNNTEIPGATGSEYVAEESGDYTVKVTLTGCSSPVSGVTTVTVNPVPELPVITPDGGTTFCAGGSVKLTSSAPAGNQWYRNNVIIPGATATTYIAEESGDYTVKVTLTGCSSPVSGVTTVTVNPVPELPVITPDGGTTFCAGGSVKLTSSAPAGNQWYRNNAIIPGATGSEYVAEESGDYTVKVTLTGCSSPVSGVTTVTVNPIPELPTVTITGGTTFCTGGSVTLTSSAPAGNQWYKNNAIIPGATAPTYTVEESGDYSVKVTLTGCTSPVSTVTIVTVNPIPVKPVVTIAGETTFCTGGSVTLTSSAPAGNQWYKNNEIIPGATAPTYVAAESGDYSVKVTLTGCTSPVSTVITVTVNPIPTIPTITAGTPTSFCDGGSTILTSSSLTGNQWYKEGILIPTATSKTYTATESGNYTLTVTSTAGCTSPISLPIAVTEVPYPVTPGISPSNTTTFCEGGIVTLTSTSSFGNQWYKNGVLIPNATNPTYDVNTIGVYTVKVTNTTGCTSPVSSSTTVTVTPVPKGFDDNLSPLTCTQSSINYQLQANINNTLKGGNAVPSSFTWTVNSPVLGAVNGSGNSINATLINTGITPQEVVYTVTPRALTGGCDGVPFKIKISVPVCLGISITKTADRNYVSSAGDKINYTITVKNTGHANHNQVVVNDPLTGGVLSNPTGDNGNRILEKDESWVYRTSYTLTQSDLDNNGAPSANIRKVQNVAMVQSAEAPIPSADVADVAIRQRPIIILVKTGVLNNDYKTINYTFLITNKGNVTLRDVELTDPKIPGLLISGPAVLAPGGWTTVTASYTITEAEKKAGIVSNTATATGAYRPGDRVSDISGTNAGNDDPTVIDVVRYPAAVDDFAKTKADIEVMVPVANNDRPSLFPLDVSTIDVKTQPLNGVLQMNRDGRIIYQPNKGYSGVEKFTYMINDENGLRSNVAVVTINVVPPDLEIPNTFTPNGDGKNDTFLIKGRENYDTIEISIFNRWGDEVYRSKNYKDEWDGAGLNEGTYFYVLKLKKGSNEESRRSWVLIKR